MQTAGMSRALYFMGFFLSHSYLDRQKWQSLKIVDNVSYDLSSFSFLSVCPCVRVLNHCRPHIVAKKLDNFIFFFLFFLFARNLLNLRKLLQKDIFAKSGKTCFIPVCKLVCLVDPSLYYIILRYIYIIYHSLLCGRLFFKNVSISYIRLTIFL